MHNTGNSGGLALRVRAKQSMRAHRAVLAVAGYAAAGFAAANAFVLDGLAPFGVAFAASVHPKYCAASAAGALLGYLITPGLPDGIQYIAAMLILFLLRWGVSSGAMFSGIRIPGYAFTAVSLALPSYAVLFATSASVYDAVLATAELLLACCVCYFFTRTEQTLELGLQNMQQADITSVIITFCIAILALINLTVAGLSIGRILAVLVVLLAARAAGEAGGAIAGISAGICAGMFSGQQSFLMGTYGLGGLLAGVFSPLGRVASAASLLLVNTFALLASRRTTGREILLEVLTAGVLSMLVPDGLMRRLSRHGKANAGVQAHTYKSMLTSRLNFVSGALRDVAVTTRQVNEKLAGMVSGDVSSVYQCAADRVCRKCRSKSNCWQLRYNDTSNALNEALGVLRRTGSLTRADFPDYFARSCLNLDGMIAQIVSIYGEYAARERVRRKVAQVRGVVTDQFEGMALMIDAMGGELDTLTAQDERSAAQVRQYMQTLTIFPDEVSCTLDSDANMTLRMVIPTYKLPRLDMTDLTLQVSDICARTFDLPVRRAHTEKGLTSLTFSEKAVYTVRWGAAQISSGQSRLCGDSYSYVDGRAGRVNIILSDGMGSGGAAAVDSTMTAELLGRLLEAGVSPEAALKLVNSVLLVKSGDESLATIDITGIDLYTGRVDFYKAGAAPTFIRKAGKGGYVQSSSLPVGILGGVTFEKNTLTMRDGDLVVMVSDGAVTSGYDWIVSELEYDKKGDPKRLSERLVQEAKRRRNDGHEDDITVIAVVLEKN